LKPFYPMLAVGRAPGIEAACCFNALHMANRDSFQNYYPHLKKSHVCSHHCQEHQR